MSLEISMSKDGYKVLKVAVDDKKIYLGSIYNQKREIKKIIKGLNNITEKDNYIIWGLSFGEHIKEILEKTYENSKIFIIEFNEELKEYCKNDTDIRKILENPRVILFDKEEDIKCFFSSYITEVNVNQLKAVIYSNYLNCYKNEIMKTYSIIRDELLSVILMKNTSVITGDLRFNNFLGNLKYMTKATPVNNLKDRYKNTPAIIVSAGPSLSKNIDNLKGVNNALILSGGRTLAPLMDRSISPSCIGIVDPNDVSYKLVENYIDKIDCPLIFNDQINPKILEKHSEGNFITRINKFLDDIWDEPPYILSGGGSIAHSLTVMALYMGCNPIVFIGQDFAYTGEKGHDVSAGNRWKELTFDQYKRNDDIYIEDINGEPVRTSLLLNDYKNSMEEIIKAWSEVEFINATEGGANIKGTKVENLEDVLRSFHSKKIIPIKEYLLKDDKTDKMIEKLQEALDDFNKYIKLCNKGIGLVEDYKESYYLKDDKKLKYSNTMLSKIDEEIRKNLKQLYILNFALSKSIYEVELNEEFMVNKSDSEEEIFIKNVSRSKGLYLAIRNVLKDNLYKIEKIIDELKENSYAG